MPSFCIERGKNYWLRLAVDTMTFAFRGTSDTELSLSTEVCRLQEVARVDEIKIDSLLLRSHQTIHIEIEVPQSL